METDRKDKIIAESAKIAAEMNEHIPVIVKWSNDTLATQCDKKEIGYMNSACNSVKEVTKNRQSER